MRPSQNITILTYSVSLISLLGNYLFSYQNVQNAQKVHIVSPFYVLSLGKRGELFNKYLLKEILIPSLYPP